MKAFAGVHFVPVIGGPDQADGCRDHHDGRQEEANRKIFISEEQYVVGGVGSEALDVLLGSPTTTTWLFLKWSTSASPRPQPAADRPVVHHEYRADDRHAALHEPGAVATDRAGCGYPHRRVFAGVLLYELLTGTTPFDQERMKKSGLDEVKRIIREEEPPRPSTRLSTLDAALDTIAEKHHADLRTLAQQLRGELDWIVMKSSRRTERVDTNRPMNWPRTCSGTG